jgi:flagellar FliJ protein
MIMVAQTRLDKIISVKEKEKVRLLAEHSDAVSQFEASATRLYELLKQSEDVKLGQEQVLKNGSSIQAVKRNQAFIQTLDRSLLQLQKEVVEARKNMEHAETILLEKQIEVEKFKKMREKKLKEMLSFLHYEESKQMDEMSLQLYMNRGN